MNRIESTALAAESTDMSPTHRSAATLPISRTRSSARVGVWCAVLGLALSSAPALAQAEPSAAPPSDGAAASKAPEPKPSAPAPANDVRERLGGTFSYAGGAAQRAGIEAAIDRSLDGMFFVAKPIARSKLRSSTQVKDSIGFAFAGGFVTSTASGTGALRSPENGSAVAYTIDGEKLRVSHLLRADGHLIQTFVAADGSRTNDYAVSADGRRMNVAVTLSSPKLPRAVHYVLTYQRTQAR